MKYTLHKLVVLAVAILVCACAEPSVGDYSELEQESLDAWMNQNYPNWKTDADFEYIKETGLYIQFLERSTLVAPADTLAEVNDWVRIDYTGRTLDDNVYYTRNEETAKIEGTYTTRTHYTPNFLFIAEKNSTMPQGMYDALLKMKIGDVVRLFMPSTMFYGGSGLSSGNVGYNGQSSVGGNVPVIVDSLKIIEFETNPIDAENRAVRNFATNKWGMQESDTLKQGLYKQLCLPFPFERDSIVKNDTIASVYYKGYFLDGFVFDTNIDSIQMDLWGEVTNKGPMKINLEKESKSYTSVIAAWQEALLDACMGDKIRIVFTSAYGYGIQGKPAERNKISSPTTDSSNDDYYNQMNYYNMMNMYGGGGGYGYGNNYNNMYNNYYGGGYNPYMYGYGGTDTSSSETTDDGDDEVVTITTEILPFTPLAFDIYIVPNDGSGEIPDNDNK